MTNPFVLGLTGSIGMGKSTTAQMFADEGIPVWDADATVHQLYTGDTPAVRQIAAMIPEAVKNYAVDRNVLKAAIAKDKSILGKLEAIVQPFIAASRETFITSATNDIVIIDHPLLLESKSDAYCDAILVVSVHPEVQRQRVLGRGTMDPETLDIILSKQMPDAEKRSHADFIVETTTIDGARVQVKAVINQIREHLDA